MGSVINDAELGNNLFNSLWTTFIIPEIEKRGSSFDKNQKIYRAIIIIHQSKPLVRINEEFRVKVAFKLKPNLVKDPMNPLYPEEFDENFEAKIDEPLLKGNQYFLMMFFRNRWQIYMSGVKIKSE